MGWKKGKRILALWTALVYLTGSLAGCGANGTPDAGQDAVAESGAGTVQAGTDSDGTGAADTAARDTEGAAGKEGATEAENAEEKESAAEDGGSLGMTLPPLNMPDDKYRTFYEVFVYSFYDSDGDGIGDLKGLTQKLDYINDGDDATDTDLGCNGIWLMPIMPSTTYHKYDVTDYYGIDEQYGTMEDFDAFMAECKKRDIHVILDLVLNHTSSSHPWFIAACDYLKQLEDGQEPDAGACPYVEYYNFSREKGAGYCELDGTWYYEARFWSEMPDLNLGNEKVREEIGEIVDFWLAKGVDGFRLDAAKEYYSGTVDANVEVLEWFNGMVKEKKEDAYLVAEVWADMETYAAYYGSGIDSVFNFAFADYNGVIANAVKGTAPASGFGKALCECEEKFASYNENYVDAPFYTNHDLSRSAGYYAGDEPERQVKMAGGMNLMMGGCAFVYYGEELGMKGSGKDENKRAPMYWSKDAAAEGMCRGPQDMDEVRMVYDSLEEQAADKASIYQYYKDAIRLRNTYPEIARGKTEFLEEKSDDQVCVIKKVYEGSEILLLINVSEGEKKVDVAGLTLNGKEADGNWQAVCDWTDSAQTGRWIFCGRLLTGEEQAVMSGTEVTMPPYSVLLFR